MHGFVSRTAERNIARRIAFSVSAVFLLIAASCVERTVSINTEPEGATIILNDQEVGKSPVKVPFTWYGDYDIVIRKHGYQTIETHHRLRTPWYQYPIIDLFAETLIPFTVHDDRVLETFALQAYKPPSKEALLERADELRADALSPGAP